VVSPGQMSLPSSLLCGAESEKNFASTIWLTKKLSTEKDCTESAGQTVKKVLFLEKHLRELPGALRHQALIKLTEMHSALLCDELVTNHGINYILLNVIKVVIHGVAVVG
jgi:hypothetical protein